MRPEQFEKAQKIRDHIDVYDNKLDSIDKLLDAIEEERTVLKEGQFEDTKYLLIKVFVNGGARNVYLAKGSFEEYLEKEKEVYQGFLDTLHNQFAAL